MQQPMWWTTKMKCFSLTSSNLSIFNIKFLTWDWVIIVIHVEALSILHGSQTASNKVWLAFKINPFSDHPVHKRHFKERSSTQDVTSTLIHIYLKPIFLDFRIVPELTLCFPFCVLFLSSFSALLWIILPCILHIFFQTNAACNSYTKTRTGDIFLIVSLKISSLDKLPLQYITDLVSWIRCINLPGFIMHEYVNKQVPKNWKEEKCNPFPLRPACTIGWDFHRTVCMRKLSPGEPCNHTVQTIPIRHLSTFF